MKTYLCCLLIGIIAAGSYTTAYGAETLVCKYQETFKDGGSRSAGLELTVEGGEITGIDYHNAIASGKRGAGTSAPSTPGEGSRYGPGRRT